jgi:saccharopine dehydrogenase-like NADP-dependent oxidoreductase
LLPDPSSLAPGYIGKTCIGNFIRGIKNNEPREIFIYNICDHAECYEEVESQAISYTAGVPVAAAAILVASGEWDVKKMVNVEELEPKPFIDLIDKMGLPTEVIEAPVAFQAPVIESLETV